MPHRKFKQQPKPEAKTAAAAPAAAIDALEARLAAALQHATDLETRNAALTARVAELEAERSAQAKRLAPRCFDTFNAVWRGVDPEPAALTFSNPSRTTWGAPALPCSLDDFFVDARRALYVPESIAELQLTVWKGLILILHMHAVLSHVFVRTEIDISRRRNEEKQTAAAHNLKPAPPSPLPSAPAKPSPPPASVSANIRSATPGAPPPPAATPVSLDELHAALSASIERWVDESLTARAWLLFHPLWLDDRMFMAAAKFVESRNIYFRSMPVFWARLESPRFNPAFALAAVSP